MSAPAYSTHHETRQQLDELDALLQRMLTLPVSEPELATPIAEEVRSPQFTVLPPTLPQPPSPSWSNRNEGIVPAWRVSEPPLAAAVEEVPLAFAPTAPYPYSMVYGQPLPERSVPMPAVELPPPLPTAKPAADIAPAWAIPVAASPSRSPSIWSVPFVVVNHLFDATTFLLGPFGAWLRSPSGGRVLGALGVLMILGAAGWAAFERFGKIWSP
jgi:hypothetical protein